MEQVKIDRGKPVFLKWIDSASLNGWKYGRAAEGSLSEMDSIGFVVNNSTEFLTITTSMDVESQGYMAPLSIPWACITDIQELEF